MNRVEEGKPARNGLHKILIGAATIIVTLAIVSGIAMYGDMQEMKGNRFTIEDYLNSEIRRRAEIHASIDSVETQLRAEWLEGIARIETKIEQLRVYHMQNSR